MKIAKGLRTGIAITVFAIPVLLIAIIHLDGNNHFALPVYFAEDSVKTPEGHYEVTEARTIPAFTFTDQYGRPFGQEELKGQIWVAGFIFTRCPGICIDMTNQLVRVQESIAKSPEVKIVCFTVDPAYDSVEVLKAYADRYKAVKDRWYFLTGKDTAIYDLAKNGFLLSALMDGDSPTDISHAEKFVLIDKNGWIRGYYTGTEKEEVDRLLVEIDVLREIYKDKEDAQ